MSKVSFSIVLFLSVLMSCSRTDCPWETETDEFTEENLRSNVLTGVYKISTGSTDNSFISDSLSKSILYILADSTSPVNNTGQLHFVQFPYWENKTSTGQLGEFYGTWQVQIDKGGIFSKNLFVFSPAFSEGKEDPGKSIVMRHDIRMRNGNPLLIVTVLKDFSNDGEFGNTLVYNSTKSKDACNYLIFEKSEEINQSMKSAIIHEIDSVNSTKFHF